MPDAPSEFLYKRVLLKVSGEVLMGDQPYGVDMKTVDVVAAAVAAVARQGSRYASSSAGATSSGACRRPLRGWTGPTPTTWACWPPS
jgi:hypothetical protein